jgi:hypothetical protein
MVAPETVVVSWFHSPSVPVPITVPDGSVTVTCVPGSGVLDAQVA